MEKIDLTSIIDKILNNEFINLLTGRNWNKSLDEAFTTVSMFNPMDVVRVAVVAVAVWLALKIAKKGLKIAAILGIAVLIVIRFL